MIAQIPPRPPPLATPQMAVRATLRQWLQADATRLAACYWWPTHRLEDAQLEMRLHLARLLETAKVGRGMSGATRDFADEVLQVAINDMGEVHDRHGLELCQIASDARRAGLTTQGTIALVVKAARAMQPLPPPWLVTEAARTASIVPSLSRLRSRQAARRVKDMQHA